MDQPVGEEDHPLREVVLGEPGDHPLLLHIGAPRDVEDEVPQILPVPAQEGGMETQREGGMGNEREEGVRTLAYFHWGA